MLSKDDRCIGLCKKTYTGVINKQLRSGLKKYCVVKVKQLCITVVKTRSSTTAEKQRVSCPRGGG